MSVTARKSEPGVGWKSFDYDLVVCQDFDALLKLQGEPTSPTELVSRAFDVGRVLIQAKGGSGKTTILEQIGYAGAASGAKVSRLDALVWADSFDGKSADRAVPEHILDLSIPSVSGVELRKGQRFLLLIDGLNEIAPSLGAHLLDEVDQLAAHYPSLAVFVTDRLHRRQVSSKLWILATLSPVPWERVCELLGDEADDIETSLRVPYYLNLAIRGDRGSRSEQHRTFLLKHGGVDSQRLDDLASAAYTQYQENGDRGVDLDSLTAAVGQSVVDSLTSAGSLLVEPTCRFAHHLVHDYLAASHAASRPELWNEDGFDTLTFSATSMDALAMVLEQAPKDADLLVRRVYDWNFYGAASLIAEDRDGEAHVSAAMELAVVIMLGERRFDRFASTVERVSDGLSVIDSEVAREMMATRSKEDIIDYVRRNASRYGETPWLADWVELYTRPLSQLATLEDVNVVASDDSVLGWTMSNVLRRSRLDKNVALRLARLARVGNTVAVRWRSVHALGVVPTSETTSAVFEVLDHDESMWVRYGAIRSLMEIALLTSDLRARILTGLAERVPVLRINSQLTRELERVLQPTAPPPGWEEDTSLLVETLWAESASVEEQDRWRAVGASIRSLAATH